MGAYENYLSALCVNSGASVAGFGVTVFIIIMIGCLFKKGKGRQQMSIFKQQSLISLSIFRKRRKLVDYNVEVFMQSYKLSMPRRIWSTSGGESNKRVKGKWRRIHK